MDIEQILRVIVMISLYYDDFDEVRMSMIDAFLKSKKEDLAVLDITSVEALEFISQHWNSGEWI